MLTSYRLGLATVAFSLMVGAVVAIRQGPPAPRPAAEDLRSSPLPLGSFRLERETGQNVADSDLAGKVWVASFTFTRCPMSCPRISAAMKGLQGELARSQVALVNFSVDPEHDTPEVLKRYAAKQGANPARWWFLTGPRDALFSLILDRFKLHVGETSAGERQANPSAEAVIHTTRLALVDRGNQVVGFFDADEADARRELVDRARQLDAASLPAINATLNGTCAVLLAVGWLLIRLGRWKAHAICMVAGVVDSALFLTCYLFYHFLVGHVPFRGVGPSRFAYFTILISHTLLAVSMLPLIGLTLWRAFRGDFVRHARMARITFPIWLYVSITGVVIYVMLYRLPVATASLAP